MKKTIVVPLKLALGNSFITEEFYYFLANATNIYLSFLSNEQ